MSHNTVNLHIHIADKDSLKEFFSLADFYGLLPSARQAATTGEAPSYAGPIKLPSYNVYVRRCIRNGLRAYSKREWYDLVGEYRGIALAIQNGQTMEEADERLNALRETLLLTEDEG